MGLDLHFLSQAEKENICSHQFLNWWQQGSTGALHLDGFESYVHTNKKDHPLDGLFYLVDDIGLEPMTFRTSSGCSSQLS